MTGKIPRIGWVLLALFVVLPTGIRAQVGASAEAEKKKQEKEEAQAKIKEFHEAFKESESEGGKAAAVGILSQVDHSLVANELVKLMKVPMISVRQAAAVGLGRYKNNAQVSDILLRYGSGEKIESVKMAILDSVGEIAACRGVGRLPEFYEDTIPVAGKAIEASGAIGSRDLVDPLIKQMEKLERLRNINNIPGRGGMGGGMGGGGGGNLPRNIGEQGVRRKEELLPKVKAALQ